MSSTYSTVTQRAGYAPSPLYLFAQLAASKLATAGAVPPVQLTLGSTMYNVIGFDVRKSMLRIYVKQFLGPQVGVQAEMYVEYDSAIVQELREKLGLEIQ